MLHHTLWWRGARPRGCSWIPRPMPRPGRHRQPRRINSMRRECIRIMRQRPPLHFPRTLPQLFRHRLLRLRPGIIIRQLNPHLARILPLAVQALPEVTLATPGNHDTLKIHPRLPNQIRPLVFGEDTQFHDPVIRALVHRKPQFLIPLRRLSTALVRLGFLGFFAEPTGAVG